MHTSSIELYDILKIKLGEKEAKTLVDIIEQKADKQEIVFKEDMASLKEYMEKVFATKVDLERMRADLIKWMFIFLVGQSGVIIGALVVAIRLFMK